MHKEILNLFDLVIDEVPSLIFMKDVENFKFIFANKMTCDLLGKDLSEITGLTDYDLFEKEIADKFRADDKKIINDGEKIQGESYFSNFDKTKFYWAKTTKILIKEHNSPKYILGISQDITEYKEIINKIKEQQSFLQETINHLPGVFYSKDLEGNFIHVNKHFNRLLEKSNEDIIGKNNTDLFPEEVAKQFRTSDLQLITEKKMVEVEEKASDVDGKDKIYQSFKFPYLDEDNNVYATGGISLDVTETKMLEKDNIKKSKDAVLGQMANNVSHEINNPLTNILGLIFRIEKKLKNDNPTLIKEYADLFQNVKNSTQRITNILSSLRLMSKSNSEVKTQFDFLELCNRIFELTKQVYQGLGIELNFNNHTSKNKILFTGIESDLEQSLISLLSNAKDAVKSKESKKIELNLNLTKENLEVSVTDNGCGVPKESKNKIFDAFFTTKDVNQGTGIGLSIISKIAKNHDGIIKLDSSGPEGTTFVLEFPLSKIVADE